MKATPDASPSRPSIRFRALITPPPRPRSPAATRSPSVKRPPRSIEPVDRQAEAVDHQRDGDLRRQLRSARACPGGRPAARRRRPGPRPPARPAGGPISTPSRRPMRRATTSAAADAHVEGGRDGDATQPRHRHGVLLATLRLVEQAGAVGRAPDQRSEQQRRQQRHAEGGQGGHRAKTARSQRSTRSRMPRNDRQGPTSADVMRRQRAVQLRHVVVVVDDPGRQQLAIVTRPRVGCRPCAPEVARASCSPSSAARLAARRPAKRSATASVPRPA